MKHLVFLEENLVFLKKTSISAEKLSISGNSEEPGFSASEIKANSFSRKLIMGKSDHKTC